MWLGCSILAGLGGTEAMSPPLPPQWLELSRQTTAFLTRPKVKTAHFLNAERVEQRKKVAEQSSQPTSQRPGEALGWKQSSNSKRCLRQGSVPALAAAVPCSYAAACMAGLGSGGLQS